MSLPCCNSWLPCIMSCIKNDIFINFKLLSVPFSSWIPATIKKVAKFKDLSVITVFSTLSSICRFNCFLSYSYYICHKLLWSLRQHAARYDCALNWQLFNYTTIITSLHIFVSFEYINMPVHIQIFFPLANRFYAHHPKQQRHCWCLFEAVVYHGQHMVVLQVLY